MKKIFQSLAVVALLTAPIAAGAAGAASTLPYVFEPTQEQFDAATALDANGDGKTWRYADKKIQYGYNSKLAADEWLFVRLSLPEGNNFVDVSVEYRTQGEYGESFEICFGPAAEPEGMVAAIDVDDYIGTQFVTAYGRAVVAGGERWMGIHCNSAVDRYGLYLRNISLALVNDPIPQAPTIESSAVDGLTYRAAVRMPSATEQGGVIEGSVGLIVAVDGVEAQRRDSTPGALEQVELTLTKGVHTIIFTPYLVSAGKEVTGTAAGEEVRLFSNVALELPLIFGPTADEYADCVVEDANGDGNTWIYSPAETAFEYSFCSNRADDWVFLPVVDFGLSGGSFDLSVEAKVQAASDPESFEVCVGRSADPADMAVMMSCQNIDNTFFIPYSGKITLAEGGRWYVGLHCISDAQHWNLYVRNISIAASEVPTPAAPELKSLMQNGLEGAAVYTLPSLTTLGHALTGTVGLAVELDGIAIFNGTGEPSSDVSVPFTLTLGQHTLSATASMTEGEATYLSSPTITHLEGRNPEGYLYPLPFAMRPTQGEFDLLEQLDANGSGIKWTYNPGADNGNGAAICRTVGGATSDAWLFMPAVEVTDPARIYTVSVDARAYLEQFPEDFEICVGRSADPASMTTTVYRAEGESYYLYRTYGGEFVAPEAGAYVIGIHRTSGAAAHTLSVCNIKMYDSGKSADAPAAPSALSAITDPADPTKACVRFTMPGTSISGATLEPSTVLTATVTSEGGATVSVDGAPLSEQAVTIAARGGFETFTVSAATPESGAGETASVKAYIGYDKPAAPIVSSRVSEDNLHLEISWTDPTTGANGGVVDPSTLTHTLYIPADASLETWEVLTTIAAGQTSCVVDCGELPDVTYVAVGAENTLGESMWGLASGVTGTPYPLPLVDDFSSERIMYQPITFPRTDESYSGDWIYTDLRNFIASEASCPALIVSNSAATTYTHAVLSLPKFTTAGSGAVKAVFTVYASSAAPATAIYADTYAHKGVKVADIAYASTQGWQDVAVALPAELLGQTWVNFYIETTFDGTSQLFALRGYSVANDYGRQLSAQLSVPAAMVIGNEYSLTATIANGGREAVELPALRCVLAGGGSDIVLSPSAAPSATTLEAGATVAVTYPLAVTADMTGYNSVRFELVDFSDENPADNAAEWPVAIEAGRQPIVLDLDGTPLLEGGVELSWSPIELPAEGFDDVESYEAFAYDAALGPWTNIDRDGKETYAIEGAPYPGEAEPKGFQVIDATQIVANAVPAAFSGKQFFMAVTPADGSSADDWLISPEVAGGSKVSFRLNVISERYGAEQIDVLASSTTAEPEAFTLVKTFSQNLRGWNPLEVTLPADARYFAFHYRSTNIFGVCIDDIEYTPANPVELAGYKVYCNGSALAELVADSRYIHAEAVEGSSYNVAVVTRRGDALTEHPLSNTYVATGLSGVESIDGRGTVVGGVGCIAVTGFAGCLAVVYAPDGRLLTVVDRLTDRQTIAAPAGFCLVVIDGAAFKVAVR